MANKEHVRILKQGVGAWNEWRASNPSSRPDLTKANLANGQFVEADLVSAKLSEANLSGANLRGANLDNALLVGVNLRNADLTDANLWQAAVMGSDLTGAVLVRARLRSAHVIATSLMGADLTAADFTGARLFGVDLTEANFTGANLSLTTLVEVDVQGASFHGAAIYGISVWDMQGTPRDQTDLLMQREEDEPALTVDDLEVAQFIYLLVHNEKIRQVVDTITSKVVLILGRFTKKRKVVLDSLRRELRRRNLSPVLFDFSIPEHRDVTETVTLLARMARFVIADLTDPASIPMELQAIAPDVAVPICTIILRGQDPFSMFKTLDKYHWVLPPYEYSDLDQLLRNLDAEVIRPAEDKRIELSTTL